MKITQYEKAFKVSSIVELFFSPSSSDLTEVTPLSEWCSPPQANHAEVMVQTKLSGVSGCSNTVSQESGGSGRSIEVVLGRCSTEFYLPHLLY